MTGTLESMGEQALYGDNVDINTAMKAGAIDAVLSAGGATLAGAQKFGKSTSELLTNDFKSAAKSGTVNLSGQAGKTLLRNKTIEGAAGLSGKALTTYSVVAGSVDEAKKAANDSTQNL